MSFPSPYLRAPTRCDALVLLDPLSWSTGIGPAPAHGSQGVSFSATADQRRRSREQVRRGPALSGRPRARLPAVRLAGYWSDHRRAAAVKTIALTAAAVVAFATNALLARVALGEPSIIDAASFTTVRLASGAFTLWAIVALLGRTSVSQAGDWISASILAVFAAAFSLAYLSLNVGAGALILFGAVQLTMLTAGRRRGEVFTPLSWIGFTLAMAGFTYMLSPGLAAPSPASAVVMAGAGIAWGFYCLRGRRAGDALLASAGNFVRAVPLALVVSALFLPHLHLSWRGIALAIVSGSFASGVGFAVWYAALRRLSATNAAAVQLSVPAVAACAGVLLLAEPVTWRLILSSAAILGGIGLVLSSRAPAIPAHLQPGKPS